ncbi:ABC transporter permease [Candidatus Woesearchaeota archaeon]|nr:ABC transporter permease [Candidatus Woesearchaeota archaeon]
MKLDEINYVFQNLIHRRLRSFLSVLSILLGVAAIFALVSFGMGIQAYVDEIAAKAGVDKLYIQAKTMGAPGTDPNFYLTQDDVDFVEKINGVAEISPMYMKTAEITFKDKRKYFFIAGMEIEHLDFIEEAFTATTEVGRPLKEGELNEVALGYNYRIPKKIFDKPISPGDNVEINGEPFRVVGFYEEIGNPSDDGNIYVTKEAFEALFPEWVDKYGFIMMSAEDGVKVKDLAEKIEDKLRKHKGQEEGKEDFYVQTFEDALETFNTVLAVINGVLVLIALISVVVAAVNIMNTMYTAVLERTKEIGIMKSVGARNSDIMFIFIFESGLLGMIGGIIGVILGYIAASIGGAAAAAAGFSSLQPAFPPSLIIMCILFAFCVGAGAGIMPAWRAAQLKPVDSLRYE